MESFNRRRWNRSTMPLDCRWKAVVELRVIPSRVADGGPEGGGKLHPGHS